MLFPSHTSSRRPFPHAAVFALSLTFAALAGCRASGDPVAQAPDQTDLDRVQQVVEIAAHYHLTVNMFYHPVYIARSAACRAAIEELLRLIRERGIQAAHMGNDALYYWWEARSRSLVTEWEVDEGGLRFVTRCAAPGFTRCSYRDRWAVRSWTCCRSRRSWKRSRWRTAARRGAWARTPASRECRPTCRSKARARSSWSARSRSQCRCLPSA